jgi:hypothetical protein
VRQLDFLRSALDDGAGEEAQGLFPEGYFFLHALYGLSWVEIGMRAPAGNRSAALREARYALARLDSPSGRAPFSEGRDPSASVYRYTPWPGMGASSASIARESSDSAAPTSRHSS